MNKVWGCEISTLTEPFKGSFMALKDYPHKPINCPVPLDNADGHALFLRACHIVDKFHQKDFKSYAHWWASVTADKLRNEEEYIDGEGFIQRNDFEPSPVGNFMASGLGCADLIGLWFPLYEVQKLLNYWIENKNREPSLTDYTTRYGKESNL